MSFYSSVFHVIHSRAPRKKSLGTADLVLFKWFILSPRAFILNKTFFYLYIYIYILFPHIHNYFYVLQKLKGKIIIEVLQITYNRLTLIL